MIGHLRLKQIAEDNMKQISAWHVGVAAEAFPELDEGVRSAYEYSKRTGTPLIALGSLYMYRQFTQALSKLI